MSTGMMRVCATCGRYTLQERCPDGHGAVRTPHPSRYSPTDRWGQYRRALYAAARARTE